VLPQDYASQATVAVRLVGGGQGEREVLAAEVGVPEPDGATSSTYADEREDVVPGRGTA
jgi:hypothetical protein